MFLHQKGNKSFMLRILEIGNIVITISPRDLYNIPKVISDNDDTLQCPPSINNAGDIGDFGDLVVDNG